MSEMKLLMFFARLPAIPIQSAAFTVPYMKSVMALLTAAPSSVPKKPSSDFRMIAHFPVRITPRFPQSTPVIMWFRSSAKRDARFFQSKFWMNVARKVNAPFK